MPYVHWLQPSLCKIHGVKVALEEAHPVFKETLGNFFPPTLHTHVSLIQTWLYLTSATLNVINWNPHVLPAIYMCVCVCVCETGNEIRHFTKWILRNIKIFCYWSTGGDGGGRGWGGGRSLLVYSLSFWTLTVEELFAEQSDVFNFLHANCH